MFFWRKQLTPEEKEKRKRQRKIKQRWFFFTLVAFGVLFLLRQSLFTYTTSYRLTPELEAKIDSGEIVVPEGSVPDGFYADIGAEVVTTPPQPEFVIGLILLVAGVIPGLLITVLVSKFLDRRLRTAAGVLLLASPFWFHYLIGGAFIIVTIGIGIVSFMVVSGIAGGLDEAVGESNRWMGRRR